MKWNWEQDNWPNFYYDDALLQEYEEHFLTQAGAVYGAIKHMNSEEKDNFVIQVMRDEALKTSSIEGEYLNRDSVQSSLRFGLGLDQVKHQSSPAEQGIAAVMIDLYQNALSPLTHESMWNWHRQLMNGRIDIHCVGSYRSHEEPMHIISGRADQPKIHFVAPPSMHMDEAMQQYVAWFNRTSPTGPQKISALTRSGIAHLYFVSIHPFEDGNGRLARALSEKALSQAVGKPILIALSKEIEQHRKKYYQQLEANNKELDITEWLVYFAHTILQAQQETQQMIDFLIAKTKFFDRLRGQLNPRQEKVITKLFDAGRDGFKGGLSAENYIAITRTSRATATRDLQDLVAKGALSKTGERKSTRYALIL